MRQQVSERQSPEEIVRLAEHLEGRTPQEILEWAVAEYSPRLSLALSFGGPSGMVILDMLDRLGASVNTFSVDTDLLFPEAHQLRWQTEARYGIAPVVLRARLSIAEQARQYGDDLWQRDPDLCCQLRKVEPTARALAGQRAWLSGIRRDQAETRRRTPVVEWDDKFGLLKVCPLVAWSEEDVWTYVRENAVPYNALHDQGYPSIGCVPCTRPVQRGEDPRAGRWAGFEKTECGIHVPASQSEGVAAEATKRGAGEERSG